MRKTIIIILMLVAGYVSHAQKYYFFCVNLGNHSDGNYIASVVDDVLRLLEQQDEFMIYIRGGVNKDGKVFDAVKITDKSEWNEAKDLLDYIDRCSVLTASEVDMLCRTFAPLYSSENQQLQTKRNIFVYWFGDEQYYRDYGKALFLPFYFAMEGERTWSTCYLYGDCRQMRIDTPKERIGTSRYSINNLTVK